jgi:hypothetical protein
MSAIVAHEDGGWEGSPHSPPLGLAFQPCPES